MKPRSPAALSLRSRLQGSGPILLACALLAVAAVPIVLAADAITISQRNRKFAPATVSIARGSVLHIVNDDRVTHHIFVDSPEMTFDSGEQAMGAAIDLHFERTGTFPVQCAIHPTMRLQVTVE